MREARPLVKVLFARRRSEGDKGRAEDKMNSADQIRREEIRSLKEKCLSDGKERWPHRSSQTPQSSSSSVTEDSVKKKRQTFWRGQRLLGQVNLGRWCISQVCSGGRWGIIAPSRRRRGGWVGVGSFKNHQKFDYFPKMLGTWGATGAPEQLLLLGMFVSLSDVSVRMIDGLSDAAESKHVISTWTQTSGTTGRTLKSQVTEMTGEHSRFE